MTAERLLAQLHKVGIRLWVADDDQLRFRARGGAMTPELREDIRTHRDELIDALLRMDALPLGWGWTGAHWDSNANRWEPGPADWAADIEPAERE